MASYSVINYGQSPSHIHWSGLVFFMTQTNNIGLVPISNWIYMSISLSIIKFIALTPWWIFIKHHCAAGGYKPKLVRGLKFMLFGTDFHQNGLIKAQIKLVFLFLYSRTPLPRTAKENEKKFEITGVRYDRVCVKLKNNL